MAEVGLSETGTKCRAATNSVAIDTELYTK